MKLIKFWIFLASVLIHFSAGAEQVMYVQSAKAKLMNAPDFKADLIAVLQKGERVALIKEQGRWQQVKYQSSIGWISKLLLADHQPMEKISVLKGKQEQLEKSARRRASTNVTAAATRGLRSDDRERASAQGQPDFSQLEKMEAIQISPEEVQEFQDEGATP